MENKYLPPFFLVINKIIQIKILGILMDSYQVRLFSLNFHESGTSTKIDAPNYPKKKNTNNRCPSRADACMTAGPRARSMRLNS